MNDERPYWKRFLGSIFYILFLATALIFGTAAGWMGKSSTMSTLVKRAIVQREPEEVFGGKKTLTLLLMGCDEDRYWNG
ncbi:hypothetical protein EON79_09715, partial [bacterium]